MQIVKYKHNNITQALIKNVYRKKDCILVDFEIDGEVFKRDFPKTKDWLRLIKKVGQKIQVKVFHPSEVGYHIMIVPTFFDTKQRCKECGRFYKLYCKHCYERFKNSRATIYKFYQEYLKGIEEYLKGINEDFKTNKLRI